MLRGFFLSTSRERTDPHSSGRPLGLNGRRNHHGGSSGVCFDAIVPMDLIISPWVNLLAASIYIEPMSHTTSSKDAHHFPWAPATKVWSRWKHSTAVP